VLSKGFSNHFALISSVTDTFPSTAMFLYKMLGEKAAGKGESLYDG